MNNLITHANNNAIQSGSTVVNAIQKNKRAPWIIQVGVAEQLLVNESYPFHLPPDFFYYSSTTDLEVKFSILLAIAQESSTKKTYSIQAFLNQFLRSLNSTQSQAKREIIHEFNNLIKYKIIEPKFVSKRKNNQQLISKDHIELKDIQSSKYFYFYEVLPSIQN